VDTWEGLKRIDNALHDCLFPPNTKLDGLSIYIWDQINLNVFTRWDMPKRDLFLLKGQPTIRVDYSGLFQAEDVLGGSVRFWKKERSEQSSPCLSSLSEAIIGDLAGRRVNLKMIIPMDLFPEDLADFLDRSELFQSGCPDDPILFPGHRETRDDAKRCVE
jgi:hypothetical protein